MLATTVARQSFIRPDGKEKVTGAGRYTADLSLTAQLHARFRYADHPRARITRIDTSKARALPGVLAVLTHADVPDVLYGQMVKDRRLFAKEEVRFEADIVAAVAAMTPEQAAQAARLIEVEYEPLPPITDPEEALKADTPLVHHDWSSYEADEALNRGGNVLGHSTIVKGDADAAIAGADVVVKSRYVADGSHGVPIEPRAIIAQWQGDHVTVWSSTQTPFAARSGVAHTLGIPESHVRIIVPLLGGGFGSKCDFHFEAHVAALARATARPVKLVFSREEEFIAPDHRRESILIELESGARRDGTLVARKATLVLDGGAYCGEGGFFAQMAAMHACGPYVIENVDVDSKLVYTNNQPSGSIRAPTAPQTCWAVEQHMDEIAEALEMDPVELRRRTLIDEGAESATRQVFGPLGMKQTLERAVEMIGYGEELPDNEAIGVACGWWPSFALESGAYVKLNADGTGTIVTGAQENGSGAVMGLPLLAARGARDEPGRLLDPLPGHRGRPLRLRLLGIADHIQQRPRGRRGGERGRRQAARARRREARDRPARPRAPRRRRDRQGLAAEGGADRRARRDRRVICSARDRAACPSSPNATPTAAASAGSVWSRSLSRS